MGLLRRPTTQIPKNQSINQLKPLSATQLVNTANDNYYLI